jgi:subtilisin family serine protease
MRAFNLVNVRNILSADVTNTGLVDWMGALPHLEMNVPGQPSAVGAEHPQHAYTVPLDPHGTHVAGVLGGHWPQQEFRGMCPTIRLYDFRVLDNDGQGDEFAIVMALQAIRHINEQAARLAIAGVNLSLSVPHDVAAHSCGWTPVCMECDRLVRSGVVVVTAAGNAGFTGGARTRGDDYQTVSISDPGNTETVLTVGSTHRTDPHRHGVSYFSSRGPTADGRAKPDLVAPGEDIDGPLPGERLAAMRGTSQAAAHVSGAAAMLMSRHREMIGRPDRVKQILCSAATNLGREQSFQGHGLVDVLRAMQAV